MWPVDLQYQNQWELVRNAESQVPFDLLNQNLHFKKTPREFMHELKCGSTGVGSGESRMSLGYKDCHPEGRPGLWELGGHGLEGWEPKQKSSNPKLFHLHVGPGPGAAWILGLRTQVGPSCYSPYLGPPSG